MVKKLMIECLLNANNNKKNKQTKKEINSIMKIELTKVKVSEIVKNYTNTQEDGVFGYNNNLNIRPKYQREFIYKQQQQEAVIDTIEKTKKNNTF